MAGKISFRARSQSRRCLVQALYQWLMTGQPARDISGQFSDAGKLKKADKAYFRQVLLGIETEHTELETSLLPLLDRPLDELDTIERAILLLGIYELKHSTEVPWKVVINEAVELSRTFGGEQAHKYVNGVLDRAARPLRPLETA